MQHQASLLIKVLETKPDESNCEAAVSLAFTKEIGSAQATNTAAARAMLLLIAISEAKLVLAAAAPVVRLATPVGEKFVARTPSVRQFAAVYARRAQGI